MFTIETYQDRLDHWRATLTDKDGNTVASVPTQNEYGYETESLAEQAAQEVNERYQKSYEPTKN